MPDRHFIYTGSRSGSNYLVNLLNQHPEVVNYNEVLGSWTLPCKIHGLIAGDRPLSKEYLEYIYSSKIFFYIAQLYAGFERVKKKQAINFKSIGQIKTLGVKDFHYHLKGEDNPLWSFFEQDQRLKIIHLYRTNVLKKYVSLKLLELTSIVANVSHTNKTQIQQYQQKKVRLDPDTILDILTQSQENLDQRLDRLRALPQDRVLSIRYENLFESPQSQDFYRQQVFEFLGVPDLTIKSKHTKLTKDNLEDVIENYEEIRQIVKGTTFEHLLT